MSRSSYIVGAAKSPKKAVKNLAALGADLLAVDIVNMAMNKVIRDYDQADIWNALAGTSGDSPVPYHGWYWRDVDFFGPRGVTIADGAGEVAVCESNKWDYPDRCLTDDEQAEFRSLVWAAYQADRSGGQLSEIQRRTAEALMAAEDVAA